MRKKNYSYEIIRIGIADTSEAMIGKDIFYKCDICQTVIPSTPKTSISCQCRNIKIDKDMHRLMVGDYSKFTTLVKIPHEISSKPDFEVCVSNCECNNKSMLFGNEALDYIEGHLIEIVGKNWLIIYECSKTGIQWELDYLHGNYQGGGEPRLRKLPIE